MAANCSLSLTGMAKRTKEINKLVATTLCLSVTRVLREKSSNKLSADYSTLKTITFFQFQILVTIYWLVLLGL